jgi:MBG domain (YGX type)/Bacterial Ig-like domain (group 3)
VSLVADGPLVCSNIFSLIASRSHLNDANHVALDYGPISYPNPNCANTKAAGILIGSSFTPIVVDPGLGGGAADFNNADQMLAGNSDNMHFWDGSAIVANFVTFTFPSLNNLGQINFWDHGVPKIYESGTVTDVVLPPVPNAFSTGPGSIINDVGQLLSGSLIQYGGPFGTLSEQAVLFTPRTPVITWPNPAPITYGTALGSAQLNAAANVPGTFVYTPAAGTVLSAGAIQLLSVAFTPNDLTRYDPTTATTSISVTSAPLTVQADDASKVFGAPVPALSASFIGFVNGDGPGNLAGTLTITTGATSTSPAGAYPITASGVSSPNYIIGFVPGTLTIAPANTTTSIQALPPTTGVLQPVILIATVAPVAPGAGPVDGTLQFKDGASLLGTATVVNGAAFLLVNGLAPGLHTITGAYAGTGNFAASTSPGSGVTVQSPSSFTLMFPLTQPQVIGQPAVFAALVVALGGGPVPTGSVQFTEGNTVLGAAPLNAGVAIFSTPALTTGVHLLGARYLGGGIYGPSTASPVLETIYTGARPASTSLSLATSPNPSLVDQPITFTATVTGGATTGTVVFFIDGFALGSAPLASVAGSFQATFTLTGLLSAGSHVVSAAYVGSAGFAASTALVPAVQVIGLPGSPSSELANGAARLFDAAARSALRR